MDLMRVTLVGNMARDAQVQGTSNGPVVRFWVAVASVRIVQGVPESRTVRLPCEVHDLTEREARDLASAYPRGMRIAIEGRLAPRTRSHMQEVLLEDGSTRMVSVDVPELVVHVDHILSGGIGTAAAHSLPRAHDRWLDEADGAAGLGRQAAGGAGVPVDPRPPVAGEPRRHADAPAAVPAGAATVPAGAATVPAEAAAVPAGAATVPAEAAAVPAPPRPTGGARGWGGWDWSNL